MKICINPLAAHENDLSSALRFIKAMIGNLKKLLLKLVYQISANDNVRCHNTQLLIVRLFRIVRYSTTIGEWV